MTFSAQEIKAAQSHLRGSDPIMKQILKQVGPFTLKPSRDRFTMLVRSIVSQQISTAAARTIFKRLEKAVGHKRFQPQHFDDLDIDAFREWGVSRQKAMYVLDLTRCVKEEIVHLKQIHRLDDEEIIRELTQVKGIGRWTAEMFLIFCLGRLNVFPYGDLGIRVAIQRGYQLEEQPTRAEADQISAAWHPYCTVASWYLWRSLESSDD